MSVAADPSLTNADKRQIAEVERWAKQLLSSRSAAVNRGKSPAADPENPPPPMMSPTHRTGAGGAAQRSAFTPRSLVYLVGFAAATLTLLFYFASMPDVRARHDAAQRSVVARMKDETLTCALLAASLGSDSAAVDAAAADAADSEARREYKALVAMATPVLRQMAIDKGVAAAVIGKAPLAHALTCRGTSPLCGATEAMIQTAIDKPEVLLQYVAFSLYCLLPVGQTLRLQTQTLRVVWCLRASTQTHTGTANIARVSPPKSRSPVLVPVLPWLGLWFGFHACARGDTVDKSHRSCVTCVCFKRYTNFSFVPLLHLGLDYAQARAHTHKARTISRKKSLCASKKVTRTGKHNLTLCCIRTQDT